VPRRLYLRHTARRRATVDNPPHRFVSPASAAPTAPRAVNRFHLDLDEPRRVANPHFFELLSQFIQPLPRTEAPASLSQPVHRLLLDGDPNTQPLAFAACFRACFNLSTVDEAMSIDDHQFHLAPPMGQFLLSDRTADLSDEMGFPSTGNFWPIRSR
jgi:hypothetical protein